MSVVSIKLVDKIPPSQHHLLLGIMTFLTLGLLGSSILYFIRRSRMWGRNEALVILVNIILPGCAWLYLLYGNVSNKNTLYIIFAVFILLFIVNIIAYSMSPKYIYYNNDNY